jgi:hypothetical protein
MERNYNCQDDIGEIEFTWKFFSSLIIEQTCIAEIVIKWQAAIIIFNIRYHQVNMLFPFCTIPGRFNLGSMFRPFLIG